MAQDPNNQYNQDNTQANAYNNQPAYNPANDPSYSQSYPQFDANGLPVAPTYPAQDQFYNNPNSQYQYGQQPIDQNTVQQQYSTPMYQDQATYYPDQQQVAYPQDSNNQQFNQQNQYFNDPSVTSSSYSNNNTGYDPMYNNTNNIMDPITGYPIDTTIDPNTGTAFDNSYPPINSSLPADLNVDPYTQTQYNNFDPNYDPEAQFDPTNPQQEPVVAAGFLQNKRNLIIGGLTLLVLGLIGTVGVLSYLNSQPPALTQPKSSTPVTPTNDNAMVKDNLSSATKATSTATPGRAVPKDSNGYGGPSTPAAKAKKFSISSTGKIPGDWLKEKFGSENVNEDGTCKVISMCGNLSDSDEDGLVTFEEYNFQTDPINNDTDGDGIADGNEVNIYYTDPNKKDSDNDTYEDGDELTNCYDPNITNNLKMTTARRDQIKGLAGTIEIKKPLIEKLKKANGTVQDLVNGFVLANCGESPAPKTIPTGGLGSNSPKTPVKPSSPAKP